MSKSSKSAPSVSRVNATVEHRKPRDNGRCLIQLVSRPLKAAGSLPTSIATHREEIVSARLQRMRDVPVVSHHALRIEVCSKTMLILFCGFHTEDN